MDLGSDLESILDRTVGINQVNRPIGSGHRPQTAIGIEHPMPHELDLIGKDLQAKRQTPALSKIRVEANGMNRTSFVESQANGAGLRIGGTMHGREDMRDLPIADHDRFRGRKIGRDPKESRIPTRDK